MSTSKRMDNRYEMDPRRQELLEDVKSCSPNAVGIFRAAFAGKSRKAAITAFCLECIGFSRDEVRNCTAPACPLFEVRPFQEKRGKS